ncbi:putative quinol monooxygenase [Bdellovibrio sp. ZAP7]|uniref:putative quinol monooxygenase n=1 Tax=Bdellovibrio sp. ZAP7 TaxID=2231053 RepID=UPI001AEF61E2|nr:antibiotic biosynthesis monooxygenase [Bdellovibrio sp. ZAP7]
MTTLGLYIHLEAKPGREFELENFLRDALPLVKEEVNTTAWFACRMGPSTFAIFDAFPDEYGRRAHLEGKVASNLISRASDLLARPPIVERFDVLADKLPGSFSAKEEEEDLQRPDADYRSHL